MEKGEEEIIVLQVLELEQIEFEYILLLL